MCLLGMQTPALVPDVVVTSSPGNATVPVGSPTNITIRVVNNGTAPASNVTVVETLTPPGLVIDPNWVPPTGEPKAKLQWPVWYRGVCCCVSCMQPIQRDM